MVSMVSRLVPIVTILPAVLPRPLAAQETLTLGQAVTAAFANNAMMQALLISILKAAGVRG